MTQEPDHTIWLSQKITMHRPTLNNSQTSNEKKCVNSTSHEFAPRPNMMRPVKRIIHFDETVTIHIICERSSEMLPKDKLHTYYSEDELMRFESEAKRVRARIIHQARTMSKSNPAVTPAQNVSSILKSDSSLRGFEVMFCPTRCRKKLMVLNAVQEYHKKLQLLEQSRQPQQKALALAKVYAQLSHGSKIQALQIARNDEIQAVEQCDESDLMRTPTSCVPYASDDTFPSTHVISHGVRTKRKEEFSAEQGQKKERNCT